jgi:hypothetical protein
MSPKNLEASLPLGRRTNVARSLPRPRFIALLPFVCASLLLAPGRANAQATTPPPATPQPTPPAAPVEAAPAPMPPPAPTDAAPMPPPTTAPAPVEVPKTQADASPNPLDVPPPNTPNEAMPSTATEEKLPPINVAAWLRIGGRFQGQDPKKLNDFSMDNIYGELHAGGKIHKNVSVTLNLNASGLGKTAGIEDAIIGFDLMDEFHIWVGQMLVPADRANYGGPFFATAWNYTGAMGAASFVPREGPSGRNAGATVWGDVAGGKFKYAVGVFDNGDITTSPLYSARVSVPFVGSESGYFGNATYFGDKDIVALGLGGQYQHKGSVGAAPDMNTPGPTADYGGFIADLLGEFKYGDSGGFFSGDAGYYHYAGTYEPVKDAFYVMASVATPKVGVGNIQPMVRFQYSKGQNDFKGNSIDVGLHYLIKGPALRLLANFQHTTIDGTANGSLKTNMIQLGAQAIFF